VLPRHYGSRHHSVQPDLKARAPTEIKVRRVATRGPVVVVGILLLAGCTFEHRGNGNGEPEPAVPEADTLDVAPVVDPATSALNVVRTFREATARGDLSLALTLMDRDAFLLDALVPDPEGERSRGELLLELRALMAEGFEFREDSVQVEVPAGVATVFSRLRLVSTEEVEEGGEQAVDRHLAETVLLVPTEQGWRIRHFHRSILH
jgi:ketosteroid isomerase-like protein